MQELGTDTPVDIPFFGKYLQCDIAIVTAVSPEHMEFFKTIDAVASEELSVSNFSKLTAINRDDIEGHFAQYIQTPSITTYGLGGTAEYRFLVEDKTIHGVVGKMVLPGVEDIPVKLKVASDSGVKAAVAAALVGQQLGMTHQEIAQGMGNITPPPGRMNVLKGLKDSVIIDDTYNASPLAVEAALKTLYGVDAPQRIAILGDMNELGEVSAAEHEKIATFCDPAHLNYLVTIGSQTEQYLAPAARARGIPVQSFADPISAGAFVHSILEKNAVVLGKGSQNGIFVEEALKILLHETEEEWQLVRQAPAWLEEKNKQFAKFS